MTWASFYLPIDAHMAAQEEPHYHHESDQPHAGSRQREQALPEDALLIDVRSYAEYMAGHLPDAHCLPLPQMSHLVSQMAPDHDAPIVLYCSSGGRAEQALGLLQRMGYTNVRNGGGAIALGKKLGKSIEH
ncbi:rhodanese-like domain-containing protein [Paucibacter sp. TC2R-5]|uniref:rhodanese-like domain-containing protein n=1 Tax=Paucibacter sp. TC2R-5 TaxID=2893555 RepID=UPI0021E43B54|nr:rhodanese-like domain-containing protein [Paucibacter sp. TC2R-5]MCV2360163.1 rhodanese-like domain-containing protein [Paucibacter sp. TC2R-5]